MSYLEATHDLYKEAALEPKTDLCCVTQKESFLPGLNIPKIMNDMNYGCGTTVHFGDLKPSDDILYVGVGGGLEALKFAYTTRRNSSVVAVDRVPEMLDKAYENLKIAEESNDWFKSDFIKLVKGDALNLPVESESVNVAAQNCLFNIFEEVDLNKALSEMHRALKPGGRLYISDPVTTKPIPEHLKSDDRLRAMCLSGALSLEDYLETITRAGFGTIEIKSLRPYRVLDKKRYSLDENILLNSVEFVAYKNPAAEDGACVFKGETVIYFGEDEYLDDGDGHILLQNIPLAVCEKTANKFRNLNREDVIITEPTYHYSGGGCC